jgi:MFS family permease
MEPEKITPKIREFKAFTLVYIATLLLSFHFYLFYFVSSTFLAQYADQTAIGFIFAAGGLLNLILFLTISGVLRKYGNYKLVLGLLVLEGLCVAGLGAGTHLALIAPLFIISQAINPLLILNLDIFLEHFSSDENTGSIRGIFLLATNIPPIITPVIAGIILTTPAYWKIFFIAFIFLIPLFYIIASNFRDFKDPEYTDIPPGRLLREIAKSKNISGIMVSNFFLNFFYCWMGIYMPIYLRLLGFDWPHIGLMFSIALLPFILFQVPLGRLSDSRYGEKEILIIGSVIMAVSCILIPYLKGPDFVLWTLLLFATRIGASFVEIAATTYFFKKIGDKDINLIGVFRMFRVLPYVIVPPIALASIYLFGFQYIFLVLGIIMLVSLPYSFNLQDTK